VRDYLRKYNIDASGHVELEDFVELVYKVREGKGIGETQISKNNLTTYQGSNANVSHTIDHDERREPTRHINTVLAEDLDVGDRLPFLLDTVQLFDECKDDLMLSKLINDSVPDTIDNCILKRPNQNINNIKNLTNFK
jgi:plastin-1